MATKIPASLRKDVTRLIWKFAKLERTITYGEIMTKCHVPRGQSKRNGKAIGEVVGAISEWTWKKWGFYLSSIVVRTNTGYPGGGFFGLSGIPKKLARPPAAWKDHRLNADQKDFIDKCQPDAFAWAKRTKKLI